MRPSRAGPRSATGKSEWFVGRKGGAGYVRGPLGEMIERFRRKRGLLRLATVLPALEAVCAASRSQWLG